MSANARADEPRRWTPRSLELLRVYLRHGGVATIRAAGGSMSPTYGPGDSLVIEHVDPADVRVGDVVVFHRDGMLVGHRVIRIEPSPGGRVVTRGDASEEDPPIHAEEIVGRVVGGARSALRVAIGRTLRRLRRLASILKRQGLRSLLRSGRR